MTMTRNEQIDAAAMTLAATYQPSRTWQGYSGETVTGDEVATFLDATRALLERKKQWTGGRTSGADDEGTPFDDITEDTNTRGMVRRFLAWLREEILDDQRIDSVWWAMATVVDSPAGDGDTRVVADRCLDLIIRARTGACSASVRAWEGRRGRTFADVVELLETAALFARLHGPTGGAA